MTLPGVSLAGEMWMAGRLQYFNLEINSVQFSLNSFQNLKLQVHFQSAPGSDVFYLI